MKDEERIRILESDTRFRDLVKALEKGGFRKRDCLDLRQCMECGWSFARVARELEGKGKKLTLSDEEISEAENAYRKAMESLIFYHRHLMQEFREIGFDDAWATRVLRYCVNHGYGYREFAEIFADHGWPLAFATITREMKAEACYEAMLAQRHLREPSRSNW